MINTLLLAAAVAGAAELEPAITLPAHDHFALLAEDDARIKRNEPIRYAVPHATDALWLDGLESAGAQWTPGPGDTLVWRARIVADGASSVDLGLHDVWLPQGAALTVEDATGKVRHGPWTGRDNRSHRQLWTPVVPGEEAILELTVPVQLAPHVSLRVAQVNSGYRFYNEATVAKAQSCNVDVACPAGDPYRDIIRSAAMYTSGSGSGICSGALINNVRDDGTPYFLTAEHCDVSAGDAPSLVFYFNYESPSCREGSASGSVLPRSLGDAISGSTLVADNRLSDFTLLRLDEAPPLTVFAHFAGWDRRDLAPEMAVGIHHPRTHEKRLSIENDPLIDEDEIVDLGRPFFEPFTYWTVREWDVGITEGGSSGSPLFNQDQRIVGQLGGGFFFACPGAEEGPDWYGKLAVSWDASPEPDERLANWLDPDDTGAETIDGSDGCAAPEISASSERALVGVGEAVALTVATRGGVAPYSFAWDVDGDGVVDSTLRDPEVRYPQPPGTDGRIGVTVTVTDAEGCPAVDQVPLVVEGPAIVLASAAPVETCGDGDDRIERGELWTFPISFTNTGPLAAADAVTAFTVGGSKDDGGSKRRGGPDAFGYTFTDSGEAFCDYTDVDLSDAEVIRPSDVDDGGAVVALGDRGFEFYGVALDALSMSTNGYLSSDPEDGGDDFSNDCPLPSVPSRGGGARIMPLHDDLVIDAGELRHATYMRCPRPAHVGDPDQACEAFEWNGARYFGAGGDFDVQAFLYPDTKSIAFQYRGEDPQAGGLASIGLQSAAALDALTYACDDDGATAPAKAVCIYHPDGAAPRASAAVELVGPVLQLGNIDSGETVRTGVTFRVTEDVPCGAGIVLRHLGVGHANGFVPPAEDAVLAALVDGTTDECSAEVGFCPLPEAPDFLPKSGFWFNPQRPGNGLDLHFGNSGLYGAWYTALPDTSPSWYYLQTLSGQQLVEDQLQVDILALEGPVGGGPDLRIAGAAVFSFTAFDRALLTWELDGERGGELLRFFDLGAPAPVNLGVTDQWYDPTEPGWGVAVQQQQNRQDFEVVYFYGTDDRPTWVATTDSTGLFSTGLSPLAAFSTHCPGCVWTTPIARSVGTLQRSFAPLLPGVGQLSIEVATDEPVPIDWVREAITIRSIDATTRR